MVWRIRIDDLLSTLGTQTRHAALDPLLDRQVQRFRRVGARIDRRSDLHRYRTRTLEKRVATPEQAGVVRDRHDRRPAFHRKPCAAFVILAAFARFHAREDRKSTRLNSSHTVISYAVFCLKKKKKSNK